MVDLTPKWAKEYAEEGLKIARENLQVSKDLLDAVMAGLPLEAQRKLIDARLARAFASFEAAK